jgi:hypothetical protein
MKMELTEILKVKLKEAADTLELYGYKDNINTIGCICDLASALMIYEAIQNLIDATVTKGEEDVNPRGSS